MLCKAMNEPTGKTLQAYYGGNSYPGSNLKKNLSKNCKMIFLVLRREELVNQAQNCTTLLSVESF